VEDEGREQLDVRVEVAARLDLGENPYRRLFDRLGEVQEFLSPVRAAIFSAAAKSWAARGSRTLYTR